MRMLQSEFILSMERAGRVIGTSRLSGKILSDEDLAISAWRQAVGKRIAERCKPVAMIRNRLVIEVEDQIWRSQMMTLQSQIMKRLEQVIGRPLVGQLEFRIGVPRRQPSRAGVQPGDESDGIHDPVMRRLYLAARKKAKA